MVVPKDEDVLQMVSLNDMAGYKQPKWIWHYYKFLEKYIYIYILYVRIITCVIDRVQPKLFVILKYWVSFQKVQNRS